MWFLFSSTRKMQLLASPGDPEYKSTCSIRCLKLLSFLGGFAILRKATVSFIMFASPSVHLEQLGPTGQIFLAFDI